MGNLSCSIYYLPIPVHLRCQRKNFFFFVWNSIIEIVFKTGVCNTSTIYKINVTCNVTVWLDSNDPSFTLIWDHLPTFVTSTVRISLHKGCQTPVALIGSQFHCRSHIIYHDFQVSCLRLTTLCVLYAACGTNLPRTRRVRPLCLIITILNILKHWQKLLFITFPAMYSTLTWQYFLSVLFVSLLFQMK